MLQKFKKSISILMVLLLLVGNLNVSWKDILAATGEGIIQLGKGSIADGATSEMKAYTSKLPTLENSGTYRFTTENYNSNHGAFDTNNWGTSAMWNCDSDGKNTDYSGLLCAIPMYYWATKDGMWLSKPPTRVGSHHVFTSIKSDGNYSDFNVKPSFAFSDAKVDNVTDWTYDIVFENTTNSKQYMKTTMVQGSPFGYFELANSDSVTIQRKSTSNASSIIYKNGAILNNSTYVVIKVYDDEDDEGGYPAYDYYAIYVPKNTTWSQSSNSSTNVGNISLEFASTNSSYFTIAWLCESDNGDSEAIEIAQNYNKYAYNFVTDTRADYTYNEDTAIVRTVYSYTVDKKAESSADGTVMGLMPHQYKHLDRSYNFMSNTARTLRGIIKYIEGSSYATELEYCGVLPYAPDIETENFDTLQEYIDKFVSEKMPEGGNYKLAVDEVNGDPYNYGKQFNRSANVLAAAELVGDEESANKILSCLKAGLEDWFTYTGSGDGKYFAYDNGIGSIFSYPTTFNSIDQMNDHHFHYGYFIEGAAQVALRDPKWATDYDGVIKELINDIAYTERNNSDSKYPYMRAFSPYEGHSWASGFCLDGDGNNQESTSESLNAWYGIILYGMATKNEQIRDLGIYLYTTEISSVNEYWFDLDEEVLDKKYVTQGSSTVHFNMASLVFGSKYDYATWFSADPAQVQGIQLMPITAGSYYLATDRDYIKKFYDLLQRRGDSKTWNDVWSEYLAMYDPDAGFEHWTGKVSQDGETQAHTYHFIKSLQKYGTPNTSIASNMVFNMVFENTDTKEKTYVVYNEKDSVRMATFEDGIKFSAQPNTLTVMHERELFGTEYYIDYYIEDLYGNYVLDATDIKYAEEGAVVSYTVPEKQGFTLNTALSVLSGTATSDGMRLKVYLDRNEYTIEYVLDGGSQISNPSSYIYGQSYTLQAPVKEEYSFRGWYLDADYSTKIDSITSETYGDLTLYAKWASNDNYYINENMYAITSGGQVTFVVENTETKNEMLVLYKTYDSEVDAIKAIENANVGGYAGYIMTDTDGKWSYTLDVSSYEGKYLVFVFNETNVGLSDWGYLKITTDSTIKPEETTAEEQSGIETDTTSKEHENLEGQYSNLEYIPISDIYSVACVTEDNDVVIVRTEEQKSRLYVAVNPVADLIVPNFQKIYVNGVCDSSPSVGANFWVYVSELTNRYNEVLVVDKNGDECLFVIKNKNVEETTNAEETTSEETTTEEITVEETTTIEETTVVEETTITEETTTEEETTVLEGIIVSDDVKIEGHQINYKNSGFRSIYSVEKIVNGKQVSESGLIYGLVLGGVTEEDMVIDSDNSYIKAIASTIGGKADSIMGESTTANYYVQTMINNGTTKYAFEAEYLVRAYAKLADGTYVYSDVHSFSIYEVAEYLYDNVLVSTQTAFDYLYNNILTIVNPNYKKSEFIWSNTVVPA